MDEKMRDDLITFLAKILIPLPMCGGYEVNFSFFDYDKVSKIMIEDNKKGLICSMSLDQMFLVKKFVFEKIFDILESIIIYHDIDINRDKENITNYCLKIKVKKGNMILNIKYKTKIRKEFINMLNLYSDISKLSVQDRISNEIENVKVKLNENMALKFKLGRNSRM